MKLSHIITFLIAALFITGCASKETVSTSDGAAPVTGSAVEGQDSVGMQTQKTAYEGTTGSGLLMERYKSGQIEGYRK
jgi:PBP1b-binding outer membrane lipoprotein LpoB